MFLFNVVVFLVLTFFALAIAKRYENQSEKNNVLVYDTKNNLHSCLKEYTPKDQGFMVRIKELEEKNFQLEKLNIELENLTCMIVHDLKTPLNRIKGLSELINMSGNLNSEQKLMMEMIFKTIKECESLIINLLEFKRFQNVKTISLAPVNLDGLFEKIKLTFTNELEKKKIKLLLEHKTGITILSNEQLLIQILENLISNAIKFSEPYKKIFLTACECEHYVEIYVQDQGQGFDQDDMKNLFKKFVRLSARPTFGESSNGLGLSIVKNLVEKLQGTVSLESKKGKGSLFIIRLPLRQNEVFT
jgi:signal transduction histidine kinase